MPSEQGPQFGDVVLVPFPFTSQTTSKRRPAVVVSTTLYNRTRPDVVLMPVTSQLRPSPAYGEVWLSAWEAAGLLKPSAIKPLFATLEQGLVIKRLGRLAEPDRTALSDMIGALLGRSEAAAEGEAS